jgi:hypothetical protein
MSGGSGDGAHGGPCPGIRLLLANSTGQGSRPGRRRRGQRLPGAIRRDGSPPGIKCRPLLPIVARAAGVGRIQPSRAAAGRQPHHWMGPSHHQGPQAAGRSSGGGSSTAASSRTSRSAGMGA